MWPAAVGVEVPGSVRTIGCTIDMLEPAPGRWANAKGRAPDQAAEGSTSPETSEPTSPVWPARTARPPSTTT
jgi:hypothetical protein